MGGKHKVGNCVAPGCVSVRGIIGRGLCSPHYQQFRLAGTLENFPIKSLAPGVILTVKTCGKCKRELPINCFSLNATERYPSRRKSFCKECVSPSRRVGAKKRLSSVRGMATDLLANARIRARDRGLICTLDAKWIREKLAGGCELTGLPFDLETGRSIGRFNPYCPSIDRIVPGGNYTPENCRLVITAINVAMNAWGEELYRKVARAHLRHHRQRRRKSVEPLTETRNLFLESSGIASLMRKH